MIARLDFTFEPLGAALLAIGFAFFLAHLLRDRRSGRQKRADHIRRLP